MNKETNLEHYKEELKKIFITDGAHPVSVASKIANKLDKNMILGNCNNYYIEDILDWMAQPYEEPILNDVEKEYLGAVIKPFKDKFLHIYKTDKYDENYQYIIIVTKSIRDGLNEENIVFPLFKKNTMYKGMKVDKNYTLKELGL